MMKLNNVIEIDQTVMILLKELITVSNAKLGVLAVNCLGYKDIYVYSKKYDCGDQEPIQELILDNWDNSLLNGSLFSNEILKMETVLVYITLLCLSSIILRKGRVLADTTLLSLT